MRLSHLVVATLALAVSKVSAAAPNFDSRAEHIYRLPVAPRMEVAEHLAPEFSCRSTDLPAALSDRVDMAAAPPVEAVKTT
jgi:hypothetical protein